MSTLLCVFYGVLSAVALSGLGGCSQKGDALAVEGTAPIHRAAAAGRVGKVAQLAAKDADVRGPYGWTALHVAAIYDRPQVVEVLLEKGAKVNAADQTGMTALHWAARKGHITVVEMLLRHHADAMARNKFGMTPLHEARRPEIADALLAKGADLHARDNDGMTPLHKAPTRDVAQLLIEKGGRVHARARDGRTPLKMPPVPVPRCD